MSNGCFLLGSVGVAGFHVVDPQASAPVRSASVGVSSPIGLSEHAEAKKKPASVRNDRQMIRDYVVPKLGSLKVAAVTRQDVAALHPLFDLHFGPSVLAPRPRPGL